MTGKSLTKPIEISYNEQSTYNCYDSKKKCQKQKAMNLDQIDQ